MKGTKLLTCVAALGLVLTVGGCDGDATQKIIDQVAMAENPVEEIFNMLEESVNYTVSANMGQLISRDFTDVEEMNEEGDASTRANEGDGWTLGFDGYFTDNVALLVYHQPWDDEEGVDIELYVYDEETEITTYYTSLYAVNDDATDYVYDEDGNIVIYVGPYYYWEAPLYDCIGSLALLTDVRDDFSEITAEATSEVSGDYVRYNMTQDVAEGLFYSLLWDSYLGSSGFPELFEEEVDYFLSYLQGAYPDAGFGINQVVTSIYWRDQATWQIMFDSLASDFYFSGSAGVGKQSYTVYYMVYEWMWANVTNVGCTEIPANLANELAPYTWDEAVAPYLG